MSRTHLLSEPEEISTWLCNVARFDLTSFSSFFFYPPSLSCCRGFKCHDELCSLCRAFYGVMSCACGVTCFVFLGMIYSLICVQCKLVCL